MPKIKPIIARTPEELAASIGLSTAAVKEWQVQHALLKRLKQITLVQNRFLQSEIE
jgi:hypothetical protein